MFFLHLFTVALSENARSPIQTPMAYPLYVPTKLMNKTGDFVCSNLSSKCSQNLFEEHFSYKCGQICWSDNGNATFSYTFRGIQFLIYGRHNKTGKLNLFVDNEDLGVIIEKPNDEKVTDLLYISNIYGYGDHTIRVVGQLGQYFEIFKFAFWPEFNVKRLNMSEMPTNRKLIDGPENISSTFEHSGARKSIIVEASKFWVYGADAPHHGKLQIKYNAYNHIVETNSSSIHEYKLLFESEKMDLANYTIDLVALEDKTVFIYCVYYQNDHLIQAKSFSQSITIQLVSYLNSIVCGFMFANISYYQLMLIGFASAAFIAIIIAKKSIDNTFVFVILGESSSKPYESTNEPIVLKYENYFFTPYALLIKRLAIKYLRINKQHIGIFCIGNEMDFDISTILQNKEIVIQLTNDEVYATKHSPSELNLISFQNENELSESIETFMKPFKYKNPNIILFLCDHGNEKSFGNLNFLDLYFVLMDIPHHSLQIYNESSKSNSMLITIKNFVVFSKIVNSYSPILNQTELFFLVSAANILYPNGNYVQWDLICSLDRKYHNYVSKENHKSFNIITSSNSYLEVKRNKYSNEFISIFSNDEINSLIKIAKCYKKEYLLYPNNYDEIHTIFEKGSKVIKKLLISFNCSIAEFMRIIDSFKSYQENFMNNIHLKNHKNHSIITSSHESGIYPTFGTLKINNNRKIIAGSPCMGAYIIEALMNRSFGQKSIDNITKIVHGNHGVLIREYETQSDEKGKKNWAHLFINYWESNSFSKKKILLKHDNQRDSIEDIMKSINFHLLCNNYNITKKKKLFHPNDISRKTKVTSVQEYDYNIDLLDDDDYINNQSKALDSPKSSDIEQYTSFEKIFNSVDYDMAIPSEYTQKVSQDIELLSSFVYSRRVLEVFKYELNQIEASQKFLNKYQCSKKDVDKEIPYLFKDSLIDWISHFFPTYIIFYEEKELMHLFYEFTVKYDIPKNDCKQFFYKCMNVADQVASQLSPINKKAAYYEERIKSNTQNL